MYRQMDIQVPTAIGKPLFHSEAPSGRDLRKMLARLNTEVGLPHWFFGYNASGQPDSTARPKITMGENAPGSLRILALGQEACDLLLDKSGPIQAALIRASGTLVHASMRSGPHMIDESPGNGFAERRYRLHRLVVGKTTYESFWWRSAKRVEAGGEWSERDFSKLSDLIVTGLYEQAQALIQAGDDVGGAIGEWLEHKLSTTEDQPHLLAQFKKRLGLRVQTIAGHVGHRATGPQGLRVMLKGVEFTASAALEGPWVVGRNRIEGHGLIRSARNQLTLPAELDKPMESSL